MIRKATAKDAEQLQMLNEAFNGKGLTTIANIRDSLEHNQQEVVVVVEENGTLLGFACVQLKRSFCYDEYMPEITEVYVDPAHRKKGLATQMLLFAEEECSKKGSMQKYELLTGRYNHVAQSVYRKCGYVDDDKVHMSK